MPVIIDSESCGGCGNCVDECPHDALLETPHGIEAVADDCVECEMCFDACPCDAISLA